MPPQKFTTRLIVKECKATYQGRTKAGGSYTLWQIIATKPDGTAIEENLRSFAELPRNVVIEVECELYTSEKYGQSYTLSMKDKQQRHEQVQQQRQQQPQNGGGVENAVRELFARVKRIEDFLMGRGEFAGSAAPAPQQRPPADPPPPEPAPSSAGPPSDDSIPF